ncbi:MAG: osmotically-inducible protein OsmY [Candidatus Azotimanducaceae bacterium]|jgi:osmotically-inducible protein OsmY
MQYLPIQNLSAKLALLSFIFISACSSIGPTSENLGKRTIGTQWDDQLLESRGKANIKAAISEAKQTHVNITAFNGVVLLTGQVPSEEVKTSSSSAIEGLRKAKLVHNELVIAGPTSLMSRTNDTWLTTKVKTALIASNESAGNRIKVVTENSIVYLMGLLTKDEADAAVEVARGVFGIQKIVKVFEYIN